MDLKNSKKIIILIAVLTLLFGGIFLLIDKNNKENGSEEDEQIEESNETLRGNLMINNPGLENGWHLSYSEEGSPGLVMKLILNEEEVDCLGDSETCVSFFKNNDQLAGRKVSVVGQINGKEMKVKKIDFNDLSKSEGCTFDFTDFKTEEVNLNEYSVDFDSEPDALNFETKIRETIEKGPNFAGKYSYASWGCGTNCQAGAIVNLKTGKIVEYGLVTTFGSKYKKDSRLLILNPPEMLENIPEDGVFSEVKSKYFLMGEDELLLLCED